MSFSVPSSTVSPRRYLVTGATGLVGNNLVRLLLDQGHSVRVLARTPSNVEPFEGLNLEFYWANLSEDTDITPAYEGVDTVFHAAGHIHMGWSQAAQHQQINVEGTRRIAQAARHTGVKMVHISSVNALGIGPLADPANETNARPGIVQTPYIVTKRLAEQVVMDERQAGLQAIIVNPTYMLGPWDWKYSSGRMLVEVATNRLPLIAPAGAFSVADVRDVCDAMVKVVDHIGKQDRYILAGHNLTYQELWKHFNALGGKNWGPPFRMGPFNVWMIGAVSDAWGKIVGKEPDINSAAIKLSSQQHCFSSALAIAELGYRIRPLSETIHDAAQWLKAHDFFPKR